MVFLPFILQLIINININIIDNIYGNNFEQEATNGNILIQLADHSVQFLSIKKKIRRAKHISVYRRNFSEYNEQLYIDVCSNLES